MSDPVGQVNDAAYAAGYKDGHADAERQVRDRLAAAESDIGWAFVGVLVETIEDELTVKSAKELAAIAVRIARGGQP